MNKISFKVTVISLFLIFSTLVVIFMSMIQYNFSKYLALEAMNGKYEVLSSKIEANLNQMNKTNTMLVESVSTLLKNIDKQNFHKDRYNYIKSFANILEKNEKIYSLYIAFEDDSFYEIINLNIDDNLKKEYNAMSSDKWLIIEIDSDKLDKKQIILTDVDFNITSRKSVKNSYLATTRPWYKLSFENNQIQKTKPYLFSNIDSMGITYSKYIDKNVVAIDVLLKDLSDTMDIKKDVNIDINSLLISKDAEIIASNIKKENQDIKKKILDDIKTLDNTKTIHEIITIDDIEYIYTIKAINNNANLEFLVTYIQLNNVLKPFEKELDKMVIAVVIMLIILFPILWLLSNIIVKPIMLLAKESEKVKNRSFDRIIPVKSYLKEVTYLSESINNMADSIAEYQKDLERKVKDRTQELEIKNQELERLSITDKLTNVYNRIKLDSTIEIEIDRAKRYKTNFGIIILDIDYFKKVNDTYGHQVGDSTLVEVAKILCDSVRKTDVVGRWGGEEFVIICPQTPLEGIMSLAEKLRLNIQNHKFPVINTKTASFGVSIYKIGESEEELINRADNALYKAKEEGRNKVVTLES